MARLSLLIPAYNEQETVVDVVLDCFSVLEDCKQIGYIEDFEIVVLDDGSSDETYSRVSRVVNSRTFVYRNKLPSGLQGAFLKLSKYARYEWILIFPADNQWPASSLRTIIDEGASRQWQCLIVGARTNKRKVYGLGRLIISFGFRLLSQICLKQDVIDPGSIKLIPRRVALEANYCKSPINEIEKLLIGKQKYDYCINVVIVDWRARNRGKATGGSTSNVLLSLIECPKLIWRSVYP